MRQVANKRPQVIDTTSIKKVSRDTNTTALVNGDRVYNNTGFVIAGVQTKNYETFYEMMMAGTSGPVLCHPKKSRTYRIADGQGFLFTDQEGVVKQKRVFAGDEITMEPNTLYKFTSTDTHSLHFVVTQDSKYDAHLEVRVESDSQHDSSYIKDRTVADNLVSDGPRYSNKAAQLQAAIRPQFSAHPESQPIVEQSIFNQRPSMGNLDPEGAG